jgi:hypothetical protein
VERWRQYAYLSGISASELPRAKQQAFKRASEQLISGRKVGFWNETVWIYVMMNKVVANTRTSLKGCVRYVRTNTREQCSLMFACSPKMFACGGV